MTSLWDSQRCHPIETSTSFAMNENGKCIRNPLLVLPRSRCIHPMNVSGQLSSCSWSMRASHASLNQLKSFLCAGDKPWPRRASRSKTSHRRFFAGLHRRDCRSIPCRRPSSHDCGPTLCTRINPSRIRHCGSNCPSPQDLCSEGRCPLAPPCARAVVHRPCSAAFLCRSF